MVEKKRAIFHEYAKKHYVQILFVLFFLALAMRLFFAFQTPEFSDDKAYYVLRQVEHISRTGLPIRFDELSYNGRTQVISPVYYYTLAFFDMFLPLHFVAKVIPNIFASSIIFIVFLISMRFTRNTSAALFASSLSAFIPVYFLQTFNSVSIYSFIVPLLLFSFYSFMKMSIDDRFITPYLISIILLSFTHPVVLLLVLGEAFYILLLKLDKLPYKQIELEAILVSIFIVIWSQLLIYKNPFLQYGILLIRQNTPAFVTNIIFRKTNTLEAIIQVGAIPCSAGARLFYRAVSNQKSKFAMFFLAYSLPIFILLWLKLINPEHGLIILSASLILATGKYYTELSNYISKTKFFFMKTPIIFFIFLTTFITTVIPTFALISDEIHQAPSDSEVSLAQFISQNTSPESIILTSFEDAFFIQYEGKRATVTDSNYLLIDNINIRFDDIKKFYTSLQFIDSMEVIDKYHINYVVVNDEIKEQYGLKDVVAFSNKPCFKEVFAKKDIKLYEVTCTLEKRLSRRT